MAKDIRKRKTLSASGIIKKPLESSQKRFEEYGKQILDALKAGDDKLQSVSYYEIKKELGEGGMGTVFLAEHVSEFGIRKPVAVKVLKEIHDQKAIDNLVEEAKVLARLTQGTIVELLALESKELTMPGKKNPRTGAILPPKKSKIFFMVQEFVNGPGLEQVFRDHIKKGFLFNPVLVGFILNKSVLALSEAHTLEDEHGNNLKLVHRDISPSNILFMAKAGITKLADFGVAKAFAEEEGEGDGKKKIVGKPKYMAPEQLEGDALQASDIWSFGVLGYECMTGYAPYRSAGATTQEKVQNLKRQFNYELRSPAEVLNYDTEGHFDLKKLSDIIMRCLSIKHTDRPDALELNGLLEGTYLYAKGLGPTNKTLSSYFNLLECGVGESEVVLPADYAGGEEEKTLTSTLWLKNPVDALQKRSTKSYKNEFLLSLKNKEDNPCLKQKDGAAFKLA
ncbi:MAG: serine/threonine protein kinase [Planctomycetota bacterium]|jgi:serine/threonine protein kinase